MSASTEFGLFDSMRDAMEADYLAALPASIERLRESYRRTTPVGRLGEPADIGYLAAFLASPAAAFITATAIPCDGGVLNAPIAGLDG